MKKVFILFLVVWLTACNSRAQYNNHIFVDNNDIEEIRYFLNRLECHDMFDKCVTKNFDMYISKNNDTLVMQNQDIKLLIFNYTKQDFTTIQLNQAHETYFLKYKPVEQDYIEGNKKILSAIYQARLSLGYEYGYEYKTARTRSFSFCLDFYIFLGIVIKIIIKYYMKITILAAIGAKNLGDELILKNEIQYLKTVYGNDTEFFVASYDIKNPFIVSKNITYFEYFPCDAKKIKNIFRNIKNFFQFIKIIKNTDLVVIGGGGIIFDNEQKHVKNPFSQWVMRVKIAKFYNKKILFHAVGLTLSHSGNLKYLKKIFSSKNQEVTLRDNYSQQMLSQIGIESKIIPDPVFSDKKNNKEIFSQNYFIKKLHPKQFHTEDLDNYELKDKTIGISFRKGYFYQDAKNISEIIEYLQLKKAKIILVPMSFHPSDFASNDYIFLKYFAEKYKIDICKNMGESYKIFQSNSLDYCFAMRLHSMILSQVYSIPFFAFSYSTKTDELIKILSEKTKKGNFFLTNKNYLLLSKQLNK